MDFVGEMVWRLQARLDEPWTLVRMAAEAGYEPHHFAHTFAAAVGMPPMRYLRRLRLERAAHALHAGRPAAEVARDAGYTSAEAFVRAFRRAFGQAPGELVEATRRGVPGAGPALDGAPAGVIGVEVRSMPALAGWSVPLDDFGPAEVLRGWGVLGDEAPPLGPWELGGASAPFGWLTGRTLLDRRAVRFGRRGPRPPGAFPWSTPAGAWAVAEFVGDPTGAEATFHWLADVLVPSAGLRVSYVPSVSFVEDPRAWPMRMRLALAVEALRPG